MEISSSSSGSEGNPLSPTRPRIITRPLSVRPDTSDSPSSSPTRNASAPTSLLVHHVSDFFDSLEYSASVDEYEGCEEASSWSGETWIADEHDADDQVFNPAQSVKTAEKDPRGKLDLTALVSCRDEALT
jgi:hypothetical protein